MSDILNEDTKNTIITIWGLIKDDYKNYILQLYNKNLEICESMCGGNTCLQICKKINLYDIDNLFFSDLHSKEIQKLFMENNKMNFIVSLFSQFVTQVIEERNNKKRNDEDVGFDNKINLSYYNDAICFYNNKYYHFGKEKINLNIARFLKTKTSQNMFINNLDQIILDSFLKDELRYIVKNKITIIYLTKFIKLHIESCKEYYLNL